MVTEPAVLSSQAGLRVLLLTRGVLTPSPLRSIAPFS